MDLKIWLTIKQLHQHKKKSRPAQTIKRCTASKGKSSVKFCLQKEEWESANWISGGRKFHDSGATVEKALFLVGDNLLNSLDMGHGAGPAKPNLSGGMQTSTSSPMNARRGWFQQVPHPYDSPQASPKPALEDGESLQHSVDCGLQGCFGRESRVRTPAPF